MDQTPALGRLLDAMNELKQSAWCQGVATAPSLAIGSGDERCAIDVPQALVKWLTARSEPAPFGHKGTTKLDKKVRSALRLKARGRVKIDGLDIEAIAERVAEGLGSDKRVDAKLLDVLVYPVGGKFLRHKDTPRSGNQLGTLIVEVPVPHQGGVLALSEGRADQKIDWSGKAGDSTKLRWVALFGDVDHEISAVKSGTRVTLVYTLTLSDTPRTDASRSAYLDTIADAAIALIGDAATLPKGGELYIPCEQLIVAPTTAKAPYALEVLRGSDRVIADILARCGLPTTVCELLIPTERETDGFPSSNWFTMRIAKPIPDKVFKDAGGALSFVDDAGGEYMEGDDTEIASIEPYLDKRWIEDEKSAWLVRQSAHSKLVYEGLYSVTGYFGNECDDGHIYQCAALVVQLAPYAKRMGATKKPRKKATKTKKPATKTKPKKSRKRRG